VSLHKSISDIATAVLLCIVTFCLWQLYYLILENFDLTVLGTYIFYFAIYIAAFLVFIGVVKLKNSTLRMHGFKMPPKPSNIIFISILTVVTYLIITLSLGFFQGFGISPIRYTPFYVFFSVTNALVSSLVVESIFRGYAFQTLTKNLGFFSSLYVSSFFFSIYQISIPSLLTMSTDRIAITIFTDIFPKFAAGIFLGFFFYKNNWSLLGPFTFQVGTSIYNSFSTISVSSPWWLTLTFEVFAYITIIMFIDSAIKEPRYRRKCYGLE